MRRQSFPMPAIYMTMQTQLPPFAREEDSMPQIFPSGIEAARADGVRDRGQHDGAELVRVVVVGAQQDLPRVVDANGVRE